MKTKEAFKLKLRDFKSEVAFVRAVGFGCFYLWFACRLLVSEVIALKQ